MQIRMVLEAMVEITMTLKLGIILLPKVPFIVSLRFGGSKVAEQAKWSPAPVLKISDIYSPTDIENNYFISLLENNVQSILYILLIHL